jgi:hypothetical protein
MRLLLAASFLLTAVLPLTAQDFITFGQGCTFQSQTLAIGNQGLPRIGTTFLVTYTGPNTSASTVPIQPILALGIQQMSFTIPPGLRDQPANCTLLVRPDVLMFARNDPATGVFDKFATLPVPNNSALLGVVVFAQWLATVHQCGIVPGCSLTGLLTSDAAKISIGR